MSPDADDKINFISDRLSLKFYYTYINLLFITDVNSTFQKQTERKKNEIETRALDVCLSPWLKLCPLLV